ncbi:MAG: hypothetical protein LUF92_06440 [Clostridiales bacterium]|nr:hypothetical protein [Clostridiales bacterium]
MKKRGLWIILLAVMFLLPVFGMKVEAKKIYTGNVQVDAAAEKIINRCTDSDMTKKEKLWAVYVYLVKNMKYSHSDGSVRVTVTKKEKKAWKATVKEQKKEEKITYSSRFSSDYRNLLTLQGTCKDMSGVMCILANHLGFKAGYDNGTYIRSNGSTTEHWWNYVKVDGKKKYFDVQAANCCWLNYHSIAGIKTYYLKDASSYAWRKHHRG